MAARRALRINRPVQNSIRIAKLGRPPSAGSAPLFLPRR